MGSDSSQVSGCRLIQIYNKMDLKPVLLVFLLVSMTAAGFGPPATLCRSNRDCPGFRRLSCEGRGPNFLFIFPTCKRRRPYTEPGRCMRVDDFFCNIGNLFGGRNQCRPGSRCADCLGEQDCGSYETCSNGHCVDDGRRAAELAQQNNNRG